MSAVMVPCLECGDLTPSPVLGRCDDCAQAQRRERERNRTRGRENRPDRTGPQHAAWTRLSERARAAQPWCSDCHETRQQVEARGSRLECDHSPEAHAAHLAHRPVTLAMVDVVCAQCNVARGSALPGSARWNEVFGS